MKDVDLQETIKRNISIGIEKEIKLLLSINGNIKILYKQNKEK